MFDKQVLKLLMLTNRHDATSRFLPGMMNGMMPKRTLGTFQSA
ncbi:hypothetical protein [Fibrobacter sp. UWS1]|nr:hypothetical protein [Fibrobacter sp. UWS1]